MAGQQIDSSMVVARARGRGLLDKIVGHIQAADAVLNEALKLAQVYKRQPLPLLVRRQQVRAKNIACPFPNARCRTLLQTSMERHREVRSGSYWTLRRDQATADLWARQNMSGPASAEVLDLVPGDREDCLHRLTKIAVATYIRRGSRSSSPTRSQPVRRPAPPAQPPHGRRQVRTSGAVQDGKLVGVAVAGRPAARRLDDGKTLEILRVTTDGTS